LTTVMLTCVLQQPIEAIHRRNGTLDTVFKRAPAPLSRAGCPRPSTVKPKLMHKTIRRATRFGLKVLDDAMNSAKPSNFVMSPISINTILAMLYSGAVRNSKQQMEDLLRFPRGYKDAYGRLTEVVSRLSGVNISTANGIFTEKSLEVIKDFKRDVSCIFKGSFKSADFKQKPQKEVENINRWVQEATNGHIENLLSRADIDDNTRMVLINAIYFKGAWSKSFEPAGKKIFYSGHSEYDVKNKYRVEFMRKKEVLRTKSTEYFEVVQLPYKDETVAFYIVMPRGMSINVVAKKAVEHKTLIKTILDLKSMRKVNVQLTMPKFQVEKSVDLKAVLQHLGVTDIFQRGKANFGKITADDIFVSKALHKARIEVNEYGTEAAAATAVSLSTFRTGSTKPKAIIIDKPFMFFIKDEKHDVILFQGAFMKPDEKYSIE